MGLKRRSRILNASILSVVLAMVLAGCGGGDTGESDTSTQDITPPSTPAHVSASASGAVRVDLTWTPSTDNIGIAKYRVYRIGNAAPLAETSSTGYSDTTVLGDTGYSYQIQAVDTSNNTSALSNTVSIKTPPKTPAGSDTTAPTVPTNLIASAPSATRVDLTWESSSDNVGGIKYQVFRWGTSAPIAETSSTRYADTTVVGNTSYTYSIRAIDGANNISAASNSASVKTPIARDSIAPSIPRNLQASSPSATRVDLTWMPSTDNVAVTKYLVYRGASTTPLAETTSTSYSDTTVAGSTSYSYQVKAADAANNTSTVSNTASITTPSATSGACGPDIGGWTIPVPTAASTQVALRSMQQPGSRIHYISAAQGSDGTGDIYFWDGARIIDSKGSPTASNGKAYGTDPMNPSSAVQPFKRWAYVGPRSNPASDIGTPGVVGGTDAAARAGYPDWWLFKRGETFDLADDLLSFAREANPAVTTLYSSLAVSGGKSAAERQIVGAYGDVCNPRPRFVHPIFGFVSAHQGGNTPVFKNVAYLSLHFDAHHRLPTGDYAGITLLYQKAPSTSILFEDIWLDAATVNVGQQNGAQITLRRSLVTDVYSPAGQSHEQGLYYEGNRDGRFRIEESIFLRNGFLGDPKNMAWPPSGNQIWNIFNRNLYLHGETMNMQSGLFDSVSMMGTSGDQFRPGMRVERNFFYQGYVTMGAYGGYPDSAGPTGTLVDNVLQRFVGTGTNDNRGQPGWGFGLTSGAYGVEVARNIVTGAQHAANEPALQISPLSWLCYAHTFHYATRANNIHDNIFDSAGATAAIGVEDGVVGESPSGCAQWQFAGVKSNKVFHNVLINASNQESIYSGIGAALGTTNDTVYLGNKVFSTRAAAAGSLNWQDPNRTLKTYMLSTGLAVNSADGFPEYFARAIEQRRGRWRAEWTSRALNNHLRAGFGMDVLK